MSDFITDLDFNQLKLSRQQRYIKNEIYEEIHQIDIKYFSESSDIGRNYGYLRGDG